MGDDVRQYIDAKFDKITSNLKWIGSGLIVVLMGMGSLVVANTIKVSNHDFEMRIIQASQKDLSYKLTWLIEFQEIQRNFLKAIQNNEDVSEFLDQMSNLEKRVLSSSAQPMPTYRGRTP